MTWSYSDTVWLVLDINDIKVSSANICKITEPNLFMTTSQITEFECFAYLPGCTGPLVLHVMRGIIAADTNKT